MNSKCNVLLSNSFRNYFKHTLGHTSGKLKGKTTSFGAALRKQMILESIFKTQRITGDMTLFQKSFERGKDARNLRRSQTRKSQKGVQWQRNNRNIHVIIAEKVKAIVKNEEIFLICSKGPIKAPSLNFKY